MELKDVQAFFEQNKDNSEVKDYLSTLSKPSLRQFEEYSKTEEGKFIVDKLVQSGLDQRVTSAIDTYKTNHYDTDVKSALEAEIIKRFPNESKEQKMIRELMEKQKGYDSKIEELRQENFMKDLEGFSYQKATELDIPHSIALKFVGKDKQETEFNLQKLSEELKAFSTKGTDEFIKQNSRNPVRGNEHQLTKDKLQKQYEEAVQNKDFVRAIALQGVEAAKP